MHDRIPLFSGSAYCARLDRHVRLGHVTFWNEIRGIAQNGVADVQLAARHVLSGVRQVFVDDDGVRARAGRRVWLASFDVVARVHDMDVVGVLQTVVRLIHAKLDIKLNIADIASTLLHDAEKELRVVVSRFDDLIIPGDMHLHRTHDTEQRSPHLLQERDRVGVGGAVALHQVVHELHEEGHVVAAPGPLVLRVDVRCCPRFSSAHVFR